MTSLGSLSNPHPLWETFLGHFQQQSLIHRAMNHSIGVLISCPGWKAKTNFVFHQLQWQCVDKARFLVISGTPCTHQLVSVPNTVIPIESVNDNYKLFPSTEPNSSHAGSGGRSSRPRWCTSCEPLSGHFSSAAPRSISGLSSSISNHSLWLLSSTRRNTDHKPQTDHFFSSLSTPGEECALLPNKYILVPISTSSTSSSDTYSSPPLRNLLLSNFLWRSLWRLTKCSVGPIYFVSLCSEVVFLHSSLLLGLGGQRSVAIGHSPQANERHKTLIIIMWYVGPMTSTMMLRSRDAGWDESCCRLRCWGNACENCRVNQQPVLKNRRLRVKALPTVPVY